MPFMYNTDVSVCYYLYEILQGNIIKLMFIKTNIFYLYSLGVNNCCHNFELQGLEISTPSLSLRFNGHFPGEPGLAGVY